MAFVPFSAGPRYIVSRVECYFPLELNLIDIIFFARNCIGQNFALAEEKMLLAGLLHNYELTFDEEKLLKSKVSYYYILIEFAWK